MRAEGPGLKHVPFISPLSPTPSLRTPSFPLSHPFGATACLPPGAGAVVISEEGAASTLGPQGLPAAPAGPPSGPGKGGLEGRVKGQGPVGDRRH